MDPHAGLERYLVRARYGRKLSVNGHGTVTYDLPYDRNTGFIDVTTSGGFAFAGFWSFDDPLNHSLHEDIIGGVQLLGNIRRASGMIGGRYPSPSHPDVRYDNFGYPG
jgi:hypothetical protein